MVKSENLPYQGRFFLFKSLPAYPDGNTAGSSTFNMIAVSRGSFMVAKAYRKTVLYGCRQK
jgi:hypothetical protein